MTTIISPRWIENARSVLDNTGKIDQVISYNSAAQWLIKESAKRQMPYKVYQLGVGVKRVTTDTDTCPCCRRKL